MSDNTILIILVLAVLLVLLAIFSRCNKWINSVDSRTTQTINNDSAFGRDNICKTEPSTPKTPKTPIKSSIVLDPIPQEA